MTCGKAPARLTLVIGYLLVAAAVLQLGQTQLPQPVGYVNDFANVIDAGTRARIEGIAADVREKSGGEIVVVTLPSLNGRDPSDIARELGRQWRVGAKGGRPGDRAANTGMIILLVPKETSSDGRGYIRIETGLGAEGFITDATAGAIQDEAMPLLVGADYGAALAFISWRVAERFAGEFNFQLDSTRRVGPPQRRQPRATGGIPPFVWFIIIIVILNMLGGGRRRRRGCGAPVFIPFPMGGGRGGWGGGWWKLRGRRVRWLWWFRRRRGIRRRWSWEELLNGKDDSR